MKKQILIIMLGTVIFATNPVFAMWNEEIPKLSKKTGPKAVGSTQNGAGAPPLNIAEANTNPIANLLGKFLEDIPLTQYVLQHRCHSHPHSHPHFHSRHFKDSD